ncbi:MAG: hypothetical protein ACI88A_005174 [Paraglaciecola sp.]|jgi:hypothetical protein
MFLSISVIITGFLGWEDIVDFGKARLGWLKGVGLFKEGLPVHDTIARIVLRVNPSALQSGFIRWMQEVVKLSEGEVVAVDSKRLRSSYARQSAIHMVCTFTTTNGAVIGQIKTDTKSNEITALPDLLNLLEIKGCLITIDAIGCQHKTTKTIVDKAYIPQHFRYKLSENIFLKCYGMSVVLIALTLLVKGILKSPDA